MGPITILDVSEKRNNFSLLESNLGSPSS